MNKIPLIILICLASSNLSGQILRDPTNSTLSVQHKNEDSLNFTFTITPWESWKLVSPFSTDSFWIPLSFKLLQGDSNIYFSNLTEYPLSSEEPDIKSSQKVRFIKSKTIYNMTLPVNSVTDSVFKFMVNSFPIKNDTTALPPYFIVFDVQMRGGKFKTLKLQ